MIYDDLKYTEEAHIFADQQKNVKKLTPYETFAAHIEAGDAKQMMIKTIVESYGLEISNTQRPNSVTAITALERIYCRRHRRPADSCWMRTDTCGTALTGSRRSLRSTVSQSLLIKSMIAVAEGGSHSP